MQEDGALLRKNGDIWRVPSCVHIGSLVARRIRYALTHPPLRYRVLIGQDGIFRSPPICRIFSTSVPAPTTVYNGNTQ